MNVSSHLHSDSSTRVAGLLAVQGFQLLPHLALGGADEGQRLIGEERALTVEALCGITRA
jgi:hypothetical protein